MNDLSHIGRLTSPEPNQTESETQPDLPAPALRVGDRAIVRRGEFAHCVGTVNTATEGGWITLSIPYVNADGKSEPATVEDQFGPGEVMQVLLLAEAATDIQIGDTVLSISGVEGPIGRKKIIKGITVYSVNGHKQWYPAEDLQLLWRYQQTPAADASTTASTPAPAVDTDTDAARVLKLQRQIDTLMQQLDGASLGSLNELKAARERADRLQHTLDDVNERLNISTRTEAAAIKEVKRLKDDLKAAKESAPDVQPVQLSDPALVEVKTVVYEIPPLQPEKLTAADQAIAFMLNTGWKIAHEQVVGLDSLLKRIIRYERPMTSDGTESPATTSAAAQMEAMVEDLFEVPMPDYTEDPEPVPVRVYTGKVIDLSTVIDLDSITYEEGVELMIQGEISPEELSTIGNRQAIQKGRAAFERHLNPQKPRQTPPWALPEPTAPTIVTIQ